MPTVNETRMKKFESLSVLQGFTTNNTTATVEENGNVNEPLLIKYTDLQWKALRLLSKSSIVGTHLQARQRGQGEQDWRSQDRRPIHTHEQCPTTV